MVFIGIMMDIQNDCFITVYCIITVYEYISNRTIKTVDQYVGICKTFRKTINALV